MVKLSEAKKLITSSIRPKRVKNRYQALSWGDNDEKYGEESSPSKDIQPQHHPSDIVISIPSDYSQQYSPITSLDSPKPIPLDWKSSLCPRKSVLRGVITEPSAKGVVQLPARKNTVKLSRAVSKKWQSVSNSTVIRRILPVSSIPSGHAVGEDCSWFIIERHNFLYPKFFDPCSFCLDLYFLYIQLARKIEPTSSVKSLPFDQADVAWSSQ